MLVLILALLVTAAIGLIIATITDAIYEHRKRKAGKRAKVKRCVLFEPSCNCVLFACLLEVSIALVWFIL